MSHVAKVDVEVTNLDDLEAACRRIGLELVRGQTEYRWYGETVGDYPLPDGFRGDDLGHCDHAIRVPLDHPYQNREHYTDDMGVFHAARTPYEIGVVIRRDGKPGFHLLWDFWQGGYGLSEFLGVGKTAGEMPRLKQAYAVCAAMRAAKQRGFRVQEQQQADGTVRMLLTK